MILQVAHSTLTDFDTYSGDSLDRRLQVLDKMGYATDVFAVVSSRRGHTFENPRSPHGPPVNKFEMALVHKESVISHSISFLYAFFLKKEFLHTNGEEIKPGDVMAFMYPNSYMTYDVNEDYKYAEHEVNIRPSAKGHVVKDCFYVPKVTEECECSDTNTFSVREVGGERPWRPFIFREGEVSTVDQEVVTMDGVGVVLSKSHLLDRLKLIPYM